MAFMFSPCNPCCFTLSNPLTTTTFQNTFCFDYIVSGLMTVISTSGAVITPSGIDASGLYYGPTFGSGFFEGSGITNSIGRVAMSGLPPYTYYSVRLESPELGIFSGLFSSSLNIPTLVSFNYRESSIYTCCTPCLLDKNISGFNLYSLSQNNYIDGLGSNSNTLTYTSEICPNNYIEEIYQITRPTVSTEINFTLNKYLPYEQRPIPPNSEIHFSGLYPVDSGFYPFTDFYSDYVLVDSATVSQEYNTFGDCKLPITLGYPENSGYLYDYTENNRRVVTQINRYKIASYWCRPVVNGDTINTLMGVGIFQESFSTITTSWVDAGEVNVVDPAYDSIWSYSGMNEYTESSWGGGSENYGEFASFCNPTEIMYSGYINSFPLGFVLTSGYLAILSEI